MPFFNRTEREIISEKLDLLSKNTNFTQLTPGSKTRFLLESMSTEQSRQYRVFDTNLAQAFLQFADNRFLEFFGDMLNLPRLESTFAESATEDFMFYVSSGTFGDINGGSDITIPKGTTVSTVALDSAVVTPGLEEQEVINYVTLDDVVCSASESFANIAVIAEIEGSFSNVPRNVLRKHDFESYVLASRELLKCTNRHAISNGEDRETKESYRFRLQNIFKARETATPAAIRLAALSVPGVADIKEITCEQGPGSYSIYIKSTTPTVSEQLLREISSVCYSVSAYGIRPFILAPNYLGLDFVCSVRWAARTTQTQIAQGYSAMRNALEDYLNRTDIGETIILEEIVNTLLRSTPYATSIGLSKANQFEEVYVYKKDPSSANSSIRNLHSGDSVVPLYNERVILETSGVHRGIRFVASRFN